MRFVRLFICAIVVLAVAGLSVQTASAQTEDTYVVRPGDTLQRIATLYNTSVNLIVQRNNIADPNRIEPGQVLIIPRSGAVVAPPPATPPTTQTYTVRRGDTLRVIAARYNTTVAAIASLNNIANPDRIEVGQVLRIPSGATVAPAPAPSQPLVVGGFYTVRPGDTLAVIARRVNVDMWTIARANNIYNLNRILAGQRLRIPGY